MTGSDQKWQRPVKKAQVPKYLEFYISWTGGRGHSLDPHFIRIVHFDISISFTVYLSDDGSAQK